MLQFYYTCIKTIAIHLAVWYHILAADERTKNIAAEENQPKRGSQTQPIKHRVLSINNITAKDASEIFSIQKDFPERNHREKRYGGT